MTLFTRILTDGGTEQHEEQRRNQRHPINLAFPLKAVLSYIGRDDTGAPMSHSRHGWNWKGRLIDCSETGARLLLGAGLKAIIGESCDLKLSIDGHELSVPCHVTNIVEQPEGVVFGLEHFFDNEEVARDYRQLVEVIALSSTLAPVADRPREDGSGYLVERYANDRPARLTVWREKSTRGVIAFEFLLRDSIVQAAAGQPMDYLVGTEAQGAEPASAARALEIHRLFTWVLPNLPAAVPGDVREFLKRYA